MGLLLSVITSSSFSLLFFVHPPSDLQRKNVDLRSFGFKHFCEAVFWGHLRFRYRESCSGQTLMPQSRGNLTGRSVAEHSVGQCVLVSVEYTHLKNSIGITHTYLPADQAVLR